MKNNFDAVAPFYDRLATLVFGDALRRSQQHFLTDVKQGASVLVIGGGTGTIVSDLLAINPSVRIFYVEASRKMLARAQARLSKEQADITFLYGTEQDVPENFSCDVVITNFFLDLFSDHALTDVVKNIKTHLVADGNWIVTDFTKGKSILHTLLLWIMYRFFKLTTGIQASALPNWQNEMARGGFYEINAKTFCKGMIRSSVFVAQ